MTEVQDSYDVIIVGGGPAGCSAGVFCARYGLETAVFDRGRSSLKHCAYLENFLGFPEGIDIETFYELMHDHATAAGCDLIPDLVELVERTTTGFEITTQEGKSVVADRVVAASKYDAEYLRSLGTGEMMFTTYEHGDQTVEEFDVSYPDSDGRTPIDGLYVAGPMSGAGDQAIIAAGHGGTVARALIADIRRENGYWDDIAERRDWVRQESELDEEWKQREQWDEWFDTRIPNDPDRDTDTIEEVRNEVIDRKRDAYVTDATIEEKSTGGHRQMATHLDTEEIVAALDTQEIIDALDTEEVIEKLDSNALRSTLDEK